MQKARVLVACHFAADPWLLEDVHRLNKFRVGDPKTTDDRLELRRSRKSIEVRIKVMNGVPDLVDRQLFFAHERAASADRFLLKEKANLVTRAQKVVVHLPSLVFCRENRSQL